MFGACACQLVHLTIMGSMKVFHAIVRALSASVFQVSWLSMLWFSPLASVTRPALLKGTILTIDCLDVLDLNHSPCGWRPISVLVLSLSCTTCERGVGRLQAKNSRRSGTTVCSSGGTLMPNALTPQRLLGLWPHACTLPKIIAAPNKHWLITVIKVDDTPIAIP